MTSTSPRLAATSAQYGIWMGQQMAPQSPCYLTAEAIELRGALDRAALSASVAEVLGHCSTLHMRFEMNDDGLWQWPQPPGDTRPEGHDFRGAADPDAAARQWMAQSLSKLCDPARDALHRTALLRLADDRHLWYLQAHHIALDGYGYGLVCQAVAARYSARMRGEAPPALPDWRLEPLVEAERAYKANGGFARDQAFWREHLHQVPPPAVVAPQQEPADEILRRSTRLGPAEIDALQQAARRCGQDWGSWMLAAIGLWLARHSGQRRLTFGLPVMNRLGTPALGVPCMAMNIVPMMVQVDPAQDMQAMSRQIAERMRAMRPHLYYRYGWIRGDLGLLEIQKHLFNQAVNLMPFDRHAPFAGLESVIHPITAGPVKDLNVSLSVLNAEWRLLVEANPNAYPAVRLDELHRDLLDWLAKLAAHPPEAALAPLLELPPPAVLEGPPLDGPAHPVLDRLRAAAARTPDKAALEWAGESMSYAELLCRVRRLAARLKEEGLEAGERVVILLPRGPQAIVALLATLWAGGCYVPLDPLGPPARLALVLDDAAPRRVLSLRRWADKAGVRPVLCLDEGHDGGAGEGMPAPPAAAAGQPAYLLYTSGSTGRPNGVEVGHGALAHFVASAGQLYRIAAADRVLQFAPLHFDASIEEIFLALCHGATLVLRDDAVLDSIAAFTTFAEGARISVLDLPTAYWHELAHALDGERAAQLRHVRLTIIGGEAALPARARRWRDLLPDNELLNSYGPTEASVIATTAALGGPAAVWDGSDELPIGRPRPDVKVLVVDDHLHPVAAGRPGELVLCGEALALGYRGNAELTARRFVTLPGTGERGYRTGDRACLRDGQLFFLGRLDHEVKISGLRVDPTEIENALLAHPDVREAAVVAVPHAHGGYRLAAFLAGTAASASLRGELAQLLPHAAVPDHWQALDSLPRNPNGKIDRKHLAEIAGRQCGTVLPQATALERRIMEVWQEVLGRAPEGVEANFFDLGGKSLQAIQVSNRLSRLLQHEVPVSALFQHATVQALARALGAPAAHRPPAEEADQAFGAVLTLQPGPPPALFCLPPAEGLSWCYLGLARHLPGVAIHGLQATGLEAAAIDRFDALVAYYVARIRGRQASGPYRLLGWSLGGALAQAVAVELQQQGEEVDLVAMMDGYPAEAFADWRPPALEDALVALSSVNGDIAPGTPEALYHRMLQADGPLAALGRAGLERLGGASLRGMQAFRNARTRRYRGDLLLFSAGQREDIAPRPSSWQPYLDGRLDCIELDCDHFGMSDPAPLRAIGEALAERLGVGAAELVEG
ncbi:non-ribosomal peptide synthetase [Pseudothauera rhizosphaerae]|uniref:Amino acid adenylation domain-containing protein n=1 Tax=Pseudothauera rhizosphaerae TaxID=2565932 RepID=A0A4S4A9V8_9RHOO|nr:non-ribosomal peptide synthetase [Pseudothauera rhizosphaerae]THF55625.1 amino acid adenylation domain-containing protein [Pseudothauera rhizosphaerae]